MSNIETQVTPDDCHIDNHNVNSDNVNSDNININTNTNTNSIKINSDDQKQNKTIQQDDGIEVDEDKDFKGFEVLMAEVNKHIDVNNKNTYVYKICCDEWIVIMQRIPNITQTNEDRIGVVTKKYAKFRASILTVIAIINIFDPSITRDRILNNKIVCYTKEYIVGLPVVPDFYNPNINEICTGGIHFFNSPYGPLFYGTHVSDHKNYTGVWLIVNDGGRIIQKIDYINGVPNANNIRYGHVASQSNYVLAAMQAEIDCDASQSHYGVAMQAESVRAYENWRKNNYIGDV